MFARERLAPLMLRLLHVAPAPRTRFLMGQRQHLIAQLGITTVLDVGANVGQYAQELRRLGFRGRIESFEPGSEALRTLTRVSQRDRQWAVHPLALGDTSETVELNTWSGAGTSASSVRRPVSGLVELLGAPSQESINMTTLDSWLEDNRDIDLSTTLLKIDVQGGEADVLAGGSVALRQIAALEMELPLFDWYAGESSISTLLQTARSNALLPASIMTERFHTGWLGAADVDALFVRDSLSRVPR